MPIPYKIIVNHSFIGRSHELGLLQKIATAEDSAIIILYGRRRIGKTELLEQAFLDRNILKFEGLENQPESKQIAHVMLQFAEYMQEPLLANLAFQTWTQVFKAIADKTKEGTWTIYFEETQWLANYENNFVAELKYVWDNFFRHNRKLILVLCGSSPSFMLKHVVQSKALYNRSQYEISLREFNLAETKLFLNKYEDLDVLNAYLTVGGVPEYLKWLKKDASLYVGLCQNAFVSGGLFTSEFNKIFISSLAENKYYRDIVEILAKYKFLTRNDIAKKLAIESGGTLTALLLDLELCGFIEKYTPFNLGEESKLARYCIADNYLRFYFKFIKPNLKKIESGLYNQDPVHHLNMTVYHQWLGYAFERMCRKYHRVIARILGFGDVNYSSGSYFNRKTNTEDSGYQIDLIFDRADHVYTICEIRYSREKITSSVVAEFERKVALFDPKRNKTIQKVLITTVGVEKSILEHPYFDRIITLSDIIKPDYWR